MTTMLKGGKEKEDRRWWIKNEMRKKVARERDRERER